MADHKFPECSTCINRECDPFECKTCKNGSNFETEDDEVEEITIRELIDIMKDGNEW